jgi:membrane-associated protease RseP (regulator of RpoE activity)
MKISIIKIITSILFALSIGSILAGYLLDVEYTQKLIGFGVVGLFVIVFPLFSYYRWKDRNVKDYMITKESLDNMRDFNNKKNS